MNRITNDNIYQPELHFLFINALVDKINAKLLQDTNTSENHNDDAWNDFYERVNKVKISLNGARQKTLAEHIEEKQKELNTPAEEKLLFDVYKNTIFEVMDKLETPRGGGRGGFFFKGSRTHKKRKKKRKKRKTLKRNEKARKWTDTGFPYRGIVKSEAVREFLRLKELAKGNINPRSTVGNGLVDYGTERARRKTKYRNRSFIEQWNNKTRRKKVTGFAKRLKKQDPNKSVLTAMRSAIDLQWGSVNTMRAAAAIQMYKKYKATRVLDFTAGWGARMVAAMALDIDYIGIDSNQSLKPGYDKLISLLKPYTKSKIKMIYKEAQKVNMSKLGKYDYVFTSPPYEYLEAYEHMKNYENSGKIKQPSSSQKIKMSDSAKFYDDFLVPTLKNAYKNLPTGKYICLNIPDIMYDKIKKRWKGVTKKEAYDIVKRTGGKWGKENRRGKELIFCWKKR
jgi:hypothetical protein